MAWAPVQAANAGTGNTSATTLPVSVSAVGSGNQIEGVVTWGSATTSHLSSVTDNIGNTYTIVDRVADAANGGSAASFYGYNLTGGPTTITANFSTSLPYRGISVQEHSGGETASDPMDGTNHQGRLQASPGTGANGASSGTGTQTPSADNYLVWGGSADTGNLGSGASLYAAGTNFTEPVNAEHQTSSEVSISSEYWIQTTATAANASFTLTNNTAHCTFQMIFKVSSGGAATAWGPLLGLQNNRLVNA